MRLNVAYLFLAAAIDTKVDRTFLTTKVASEEVQTGPDVQHEKTAGGGYAMLSHGAAVEPGHVVPTNLATHSANASSTAGAEAQAAVGVDASKLGGPVIHNKTAGGGYEAGSPCAPHPNMQLAPYCSQNAYPGNGTVGGSSNVTSPYTDENVPPPSTTMQCVINLTWLYFLIYASLQAVQMVNQNTKPVPTPLMQSAEKILELSKHTVDFAPMLCVLFLGTRLRALQLSGGQPEKYGLPQDFVQTSMWLCTYSVFVQTLTVLLIPFTLGGTPMWDEKTNQVQITSGGVMAKIMKAVQWLCIVAMYGGFTAVGYGVFTMTAPKEVYPSGEPPVSPAVENTINLAIQYFAIYLAIQLINTYCQLSPSLNTTTAKIRITLNLAANTVKFAPMLCVLFIAARMRALQLDPKYGNPQEWAQTAMYCCAYSVLVQALLVIAVPLVVQSVHPVTPTGPDKDDGDVVLDVVDNPTLLHVLNACRFLVMLGMYGGATAIIVSIHTIQAPNGARTPEVSPAVQCVINLADQFFFVYTAYWVLTVLRQLEANGSLSAATGVKVREAIGVCKDAMNTVAFAPMLSVLFIGLRLRALQITAQQGAPQGWAQDAMYLCVDGVGLNLLCVLILPFVRGESSKLDDKQQIVVRPDYPILLGIVQVLKHIANFMVFAGMVTVVVALVQIVPSTANGKGAMLPDAPAIPSGDYWDAN